MAKNPINTVIHDDDINFDDIPKITDFSGWRKNPFAERMRNGYSVTINYDSADDARKALTEGTISDLIGQPGLKSILLNIKGNDSQEAV